MTSLKAKDGYVMIDNRNTPGVSDALIHSAGLPQGAGRGLFECASMHCVHCGGHVIPNPARTRPREFCKKCTAYICDPCHNAAQHADYVHRTIDELTELVGSGRYTLAGSPSAPILIPLTGG